MKKTISIIIFLVAMAIGAHAAPLTYDECLKMALQQNPSIRAAEQDVKSAKAKWREAVSGWLPRFNVYFDSHYYNKTPYQKNSDGEQVEIVPGIKIPAGLLSSNDYDYYETRMGLSINQTLIDSGLVAGQIKQAAFNLELSQLNLKKVEQKLELKVIEKYHKLLELERLIRIKLWRVKQAKDFLALAQRKNQREEVGELEVMDHEIQLETARQERNQAQQEHEQTQQEFAQLLGKPEMSQDLELIPSTEPALPKIEGLEQIIARTKKGNLEIKESQLKVELKQTEITLANSDQRPQVTLYGDLTSFKTAQTLGDSMDKFDETWVMGIKLDWSLFDSGRTINKVAAAESARQKTEAELTSSVDQTVLEAAKLYQEFLTAGQNLELAQRFFDREKISRAELEEREIGAEESEIQVLKSQMDYRLLYAKLNYISGGGIICEN